MTKLANQLLMLSGFYFVIVFVLSTWKNSFTYYAAIITFVLFIVLFIILCLKKSFSFFTKFENKNPKVANYVKAVGIPQYYNVIFGMIPGLFISEDDVIPTYFQYAAIVYIALILFSLLYATYVNFFKGKVWVKKSIAKNTSDVKIVEVKKIESVLEVVKPKEVRPEPKKKPVAKKTTTKKTTAKKTTAKKTITKKNEK